MGRKTWIHARRGEIGTVVDVEGPEGDEVLTVRWHRTGTATAVDMGREASFLEPTAAKKFLGLN